MSIIELLIASGDKTTFLEIRLDLDFYQSLCRIEPLIQSQLAASLIAEWINDKKDPYHLLLSMIYLCHYLYKDKLFSSESSDFLLTVLRELVLIYDREKLNTPDYINEYSPNPNLALFFSLMERLIAENLGFNCLAEFPHALVRGVFNPIIAAQLPQSSSSEAINPELDLIAENKALCEGFITRLTGRTESADFLYNPQRESERIISEWRQRLISGELDVPLMNMLSRDCERVTIAGQMHRLRRYHAAIAKVINCHSQSTISSDEAVDRINFFNSYYREGDYQITQEKKCLIL